MSNEATFLTPELYAYLKKISVRPHVILDALRKQTLSMPNSVMQIAPEQAQFMQLLIKLMNARRTIEVGVFTGYSALSVALALPDDGEIIACDVEKKWTDIAETFWREAGVAHKIKLHLAPAEKTLQNLIDKGEAGQFDFAFIDADKSGYDTYYEQCLQLVRSGGLIVLDNTFLHYRVLECEGDKPAQAIHDLNLKLLADTRVDLSVLPMADGLTLVRKH